MIAAGRPHPSLKRPSSVPLLALGRRSSNSHHTFAALPSYVSHTKLANERGGGSAPSGHVRGHGTGFVCVYPWTIICGANLCNARADVGLDLRDVDSRARAMWLIDDDGDKDGRETLGWDLEHT